jgi:hypothetical protein
MRTYTDYCQIVVLGSQYLVQRVMCRVSMITFCFYYGSQSGTELSELCSFICIFPNVCISVRLPRVYEANKVKRTQVFLGVFPPNLSQKGNAPINFLHHLLMSRSCTYYRERAACRHFFYDLRSSPREYGQMTEYANTFCSMTEISPGRKHPFWSSNC